MRSAASFVTTGHTRSSAVASVKSNERTSGLETTAHIPSIARSSSKLASPLPTSSWSGYAHCDGRERGGRPPPPRYGTTLFTLLITCAQVA